MAQDTFVCLPSLALNQISNEMKRIASDYVCIYVWVCFTEICEACHDPSF